MSWKNKVFGLVSLAVIAAVPGVHSAGKLNAAPQDYPKIGTIISGYKNPKRITVIKSLSCVFCKTLDRQLVPKTIIDLQKKGYEVEIIPVLLGERDIVPTAILNCGNAKNFTARMRRLFNSSSLYNGKTQTEAEEIALSRSNDYGLTEKKLKSCLTAENYKKVQNLTVRAKAIYKYEGTPSVYLNGRFLGNGIQELKEL